MFVNNYMFSAWVAYKSNIVCNAHKNEKVAHLKLIQYFAALVSAMCTFLMKVQHISYMKVHISYESARGVTLDGIKPAPLPPL